MSFMCYLFIYFVLIIYVIMLVCMKHDWLNWLCTCFVIRWLWVQTLVKPKLSFPFPKLDFGKEEEKG